MATTELIHSNQNIHNGAGQVVITPPRTTSLAPADYSEAERLATAMFKSQMFGVKSPEQAMVVLMTGLELGFSPAQAFRGIHVINNKPTLSADMMVTICKSRPDVCEYFRLVESTDDRAVYETLRVGEPEPTQNQFTMADAKRAGLLTNPTWQKFQPQMLRARASSGLARVVYPDLILGLYTPDEMESAEPAPVPREPAPRPVVNVTPAPDEDPIKAERLKRSAPLISLLMTLPKEVQNQYRAEWDAKYGTLNPKMLEFDAIDAEIARIKAEQFAGDGDGGDEGGEDDPFAPAPGDAALPIHVAGGPPPRAGTRRLRIPHDTDTQRAPGPHDGSGRRGTFDAKHTQKHTQKHIQLPRH